MTTLRKIGKLTIDPASLPHDLAQRWDEARSACAGAITVVAKAAALAGLGAVEREVIATAAPHLVIKAALSEPGKLGLRR